MSTALNITAESAALPATRPTDLDDGFMDGGPTPVWPIFQGVINRTAAHDGALLGHVSWSGDLSIAPGQTLNNFALNVGAINAAYVYNGSIYKPLAYGGGTVTQAKVEGGGGTLGAVARWWYLYAFIGGAGNLDFEVSQTAPNASRVLKSTDSSRVYLGCFKTLASGAPIPFRASRGRYVYRASGNGADDTKALDNGSATSNTAVSLAAFIPPHARLATLRAYGVSTHASLNYAYFRTDGDSGADEHTLSLPNVLAGSSELVFDIETDADREVAYRVTSTGGAPGLYLWVNGFYE